MRAFSACGVHVSRQCASRHENGTNGAGTRDNVNTISLASLLLLTKLLGSWNDLVVSASDPPPPLEFDALHHLLIESMSKFLSNFDMSSARQNLPDFRCRWT